MRLFTQHKALLLLLGNLPFVFANAQTLDEIWQLAIENSADSQVIAATEAEAVSHLDTANSMFDPQITISGIAGIGNTHQSMEGAKFSAPVFSSMGIEAADNAAFYTKTSGALIGQVNLTAVKPLFNPKLNSQQNQIALSAIMARMQSKQAVEQLLISTAQQYYDLALAIEAEKVYHDELIASQAVKKEAKFRFDIGDSPITGVREADAQFALVTAKLMAARSDLIAKKAILAKTAGINIEQINAKLPTDHALNTSKINVDDIFNYNTNLRLAYVQQQLAQEKTKELDPSTDVSVNLIGNISGNYAHGSGYGGNGDLRKLDAMVGIQASAPLYTGGLKSSSYRTATLAVNKAQANITKAYNNIDIQIKTLFSQQVALKEQILAYKAGVEAAKLRVDATTLGKKVGDKTTLDVLNSQNALSNIKLELAKAKVNLAMVNLRLSIMASQVKTGYMYDTV